MKCIILTIAYNAEKTIERTIKSVINQTYTNWIYYIVDNGSNDNTKKIIKDYSLKDSRIIYLHKEENDIWAAFEYTNILIEKHPECDSICFIDADDEYVTSFLEKSVDAMKQSSADLVIQGTHMINTLTGEAKVMLPVITGLITTKDFDTFFPYLHWFLRQMWGKLFRTDIIRMLKPTPLREIGYGGDTVFVMQYLMYAKNIVTLQQHGYTYYSSTQSASFVFRENRVAADIVLYDLTRKMLEHKCGYVSSATEQFLYCVYYKAISDTLAVIVNSNISTQDKYIWIAKIFQNEITKKVYALQEFNCYHEAREMKKNIFLWCFNAYQEEPLTGLLHKVFCAINPHIATMISINDFDWWISNVSLIVEELVLEEYQIAYQNMTRVINHDFHDMWSQMIPHGSAIFLVMQILAALLNLSEDYIVWSKWYIKCLIDEKLYYKAANELLEWKNILPNDEIVKKLNAYLENVNK